MVVIRRNYAVIMDYRSDTGPRYPTAIGPTLTIYAHLLRRRKKFIQRTFSSKDASSNPPRHRQISLSQFVFLMIRNCQIFSTFDRIA